MTGRPQPLKVRVGIVSWNTELLLTRCLAALPAALAGTDAEVVVVDNASTDASAAAAARSAGVRVLRNATNVGYAAAMNQALAGSEVDVLIALNPDTEPAPGSLGTLARRLFEDERLGLVAPRLRNVDGTLQHSVYVFPSPRQAAMVCFTPPPLLRRGLGERWWLEGYSRHDRPADIDWAIGAVHVIRAEALDGRPPYDERSFMYAEDLDLCWQLAQRGWRRRFEADVEVLHVGNASGAQAWGDGRTSRWLAASYDWYQSVHGRRAVSWWAAVNTAGATTRLALLAAARLAGRPEAGPPARALARVMPLHLRTALRGARPQPRVDSGAGRGR